MRVAIQGTRGAFSEAAARQQWPDAEIVSCREVGDVVQAVRDSRADGGCLAIENSLVGSVTRPVREALVDWASRCSSRCTMPSWA